MAKKQKKRQKNNQLMEKMTKKMSLPKKMPEVNMSKATGAMGVGAVVGAMAGSAVGYALSDKQRRKMMLEKMQQLKDYVLQTFDDIQTMSDEMDKQDQQKSPHNGKNKRQYQTASM